MTLQTPKIMINGFILKSYESVANAKKTKS